MPERDLVLQQWDTEIFLTNKDAVRMLILYATVCVPAHETKFIL